MARRGTARRPNQHLPAPVTLAPAPHDADPADDAPFPHQRRWLILLLAAIVGSRLVLLLTSQHYLMSDEAVVGNLALDVLAGKPIPFFLYGQDYAGGHVFEALLMIPWLKLFGPHPIIVKAVPALIGCLVPLAVYGVIERFFSKRLALLTLGLFAFSCSFVSYNFLVNGSMSTLLFSWIGLYFFFSHEWGGAPRLRHLFLAGAALGFSLYCFDYALFYIAAVLGLLAFRHRWALLGRQWKLPAVLAAGGVAGALPLLVFNFTHDFATFRRYLPAGGPAPAAAPGFATSFAIKALHLVTHDLPGFFSTRLTDYPPRISWLSYTPWLVFCLALGWLVIALRGPVLKGLRTLAQAAPPRFGRQDRILCFVYFFVLYGVIYCLSPNGGDAPRYCILFYPAISVIMAWALLRLGPARRGWALAGAVLFMAPQLWFVARLAGDSTTLEWNIPLHGEDIEPAARFLVENHLTTVVAPYELKWKLRFASNRRIVCASALFGFDREMEENKIVQERIDRNEAPLTMVLDKDFLLPRIALNFNPRGAFNVEQFFDFLKQNGIGYQVTPVGDLRIYHHFSKNFSLNIMR